MAVKEIIYNNTTFLLHYDIINPSASRDILFLHGWGSNKEIMKQAFNQTFSEYRHIYVDMPGFGKTLNDTIILTTHGYSAIISAFLRTLTSTPVIIFGHSFGGKVACLLHPPHLVLLSSAGALLPKPLKVRAKIAFFKVAKKVGLGGLWRLFASHDVNTMNSAMYATFKNVVDENFLPEFAKFKEKATLLWGKADTATPIKAGEMIHQVIPQSCLFILEGDHYFFLHHPYEVERIVKTKANGTNEIAKISD